MNNFSDYVKTNEYRTEDSNTTNLNDNNTNSNIESMIKSYQNLSSEELLNKFLAETQKQKQMGGLDSEKLKILEETLSLYLNEEQKHNLEKILSMVRNVK